MALYSPPPPARPFSDTKPTLLTSWWITALCAVVIILRLVGRFIRVERLFREDVWAAAALLPLFMRMGFVHPILVHGTNNVLIDSPLSDGELEKRALGSRLVLVARILHPATLWLLKVVMLEFLQRLVGVTGTKRYTVLLWALRVTLATTFVAIIVADLAECRPFSNYWQITPDPGGQCRQGYAQLITLTVCTVITDLLLVIVPVRIVVKSRLSAGRKTLLVGLLCLHVFTVVVAIYRVPAIVREDGYQGTRTMWASAEILMATFAGNALAIGTFVRDTGVKKTRFRYRPEGGPAGETVSARRDNAAAAHAKKVSWLGQDSDGDEDGTEAPRRTESLDSLIPRSKFYLSKGDGGQVTKITTIEVTVSDAQSSAFRRPGEGVDGLLSRPAEVVVTGTGRSKSRGPVAALKDLIPSPEPLRSPGGHHRRGDE
ncbi:hypothetical protein C8A05DRAFT_13248 [Staphylotrichum tortipilum]|uniref:Rhodopsin domain-containing protein n=1 Tax=Staphylotrichum tortipilum TaxID=2831512 RepID=A0AAN6RVF8_9PEZI|nr:hypothetical protein C8A05DRAFT_13248 [Staphylotrichum longicolle]